MSIKKYLRIALVFILIVSCISSTAFAKIAFNITGSSINIDVELGEEFAEQEITIEVLPSTKKIDDITTNRSEILKKVFDYVYQERTDEDGNIQLVYVTRLEKGYLNVRIGGENITPPITEEVVFASEKYVGVLLNTLKNLKVGDPNSINVLEGVFKEQADGGISDYKILGLDESGAYNIYMDNSLCSVAVKQEVYKYMIAKMDEITTKEDVKNIFEESVYLETLFAIEDSNVLAKYILENGEALGLSNSSLYQKVYLNDKYCDAKVQKEILNLMIKHSWAGESKDEVCKIFEEYSFLRALSNVRVNFQIGDLIENSTEMLTEHGAGLDNYNGLKKGQKNEINITLAGKDYDSVGRFINDFNEAVTKEKDTEDSSTNKNKDGGGGRSKISISPEYSSVPYIQEVEQKVEKKIKFDDIESVSWAQEAIEYLSEKGIIKGKEENKFFPNDNMTREEFAKILVLALDIYDDEAQIELNDVNKDAWYYKYVTSVVKKGLITGYGYAFGVGDYIVREDIATIVFRAITQKGIKLTQEDTPIIFNDESQISSYAKVAVYALQVGGILNGVEEREFAPKKYCSRAEVAKIIYQLMSRFENIGRDMQNSDKKVNDDGIIL